MSFGVLEIDNLNPSKPKVDFKQEFEKIEEERRKNNKSCARDLILVDNSPLDEVRAVIYEVVAQLLTDQNLSSNKMYYLLQSFYYIDIVSYKKGEEPSSIVFYIDYNLLKLGGLAKSNLRKKEIEMVIHNYLQLKNTEVKFVLLKHINLLKYFLLRSINKNG